MCRAHRTAYICGHTRIERVKCVKRTHRERCCLFTLFSSTPHCDNSRKTVWSPSRCSRCDDHRREPSYLKHLMEPFSEPPVQLQSLRWMLPARMGRFDDTAVQAATLPGHFHGSVNYGNRDSFLEPALQAALTAAPGIDYAPHMQNLHPWHLPAEPPPVLARTQPHKEQSRRNQSCAGTRTIQEPGIDLSPVSFVGSGPYRSAADARARNGGSGFI